MCFCNTIITNCITQYLKKKTDLQREMLDTELNITQAFELSVHTLEKANKRLLNETKKQEKTIES